MDFNTARTEAPALLEKQGRAKRSELLAMMDSDRNIHQRIRENRIDRDLARNTRVGLSGLPPVQRRFYDGRNMEFSYLKAGR